MKSEQPNSTRFFFYIIFLLIRCKNKYTYIKYNLTEFFEKIAIY